MNQKMRLGLASALVFVCLMGDIATAMPFDPVFRVIRIKGDCQVAPPNSSTFAPIKLGKAYELGSTVRTSGIDSEATVSLCDNNECKVMAGSTVQFAGEEDERTTRTLHLLVGKVEVDLDPKGHYTNRVVVQTAVGMATGEKAKFAVATSLKNDVHESTFECKAGMFSVGGSQYNAPVVKEGASVKVVGSTDLSWLRVQTLKGDISYDLRDGNADPISYPTKTGGAIKITQRVTELTKARHVVLRTMTPEGITETNFTYKLMPQMVDAPNAPAAGTAEERPATQEGI
jgi:hypothetical protein